MSYMDIVKEKNSQVQERYELAMERIEGILYEQDTIPAQFRMYFKKTAEFLMQVRDIITMMEAGEWQDVGLDEWKQINFDLYEDLFPKKRSSQENCTCYENSYANPVYANEKLGESYGPLLCFLYTELRGCVAYAFEQRLFDITIGLELFIQIFNLLEDTDENTCKEMKQAIYYYVSDYCDVTIPTRVREMLDPEFSFATDIIMKQDLTDLRYLYLYGEYISDLSLIHI